MAFVWMLIIGGIIGLLLGGIPIGRNFPGGIIGAWLGGTLLGSFGPIIGDIAIIPAIIGAIILVFLFSLIMRGRARA